MVFVNRATQSRSVPFSTGHGSRVFRKNTATRRRNIKTEPTMQRWATLLKRTIRQFSPRLLWQYAIAFVAVIVTTLVLFVLKSYIGDTKVSLFYLLIVLVSAAVANPGVTFFCGLWSFLCFDFRTNRTRVV